MNAAVNLRSQHSAKKKTITRDRKKGPRRSESPAATREVRLLTFTIDPDTASVVRFEALDPGGARHELSEEEKARLVRNGRTGELEDVLVRVFEAGIGCALGEEIGGTPDADEDAELRHLLLTQLFQHSTAKHLMRRDALSRAALGALIRNAVRSPTMAAQGGTEAKSPAGRASAARLKSHRGQHHDRHHDR